MYLVRENNRTSEQTFSLDVTVGDPLGSIKPATIETSNTNGRFDYSFGLLDETKIVVLFPATVDRVSLNFTLNPDLSVEGTETFRAVSAITIPSGNFPVFNAPAGETTFASTLIHIIDNDGKIFLCLLIRKYNL